MPNKPRAFQFYKFRMKSIYQPGEDFCCHPTYFSKEKNSLCSLTAYVKKISFEMNAAITYRE